MDKNDFIEQLVEELEIEVPVTAETRFEDLEEWDSMGAMVLIGFVADTFDITLNSNDLESFVTFSDLIEKIGYNHFS